MVMSNTPELEPEITRFFAGVDEGVPVNVEHGMKKLHARLDRPDIFAGKGLATPVKPWVRKSVWAAASIVIAVIVFQLSRPVHKFTPSYGYSTAIGQRTSITLYDGTLVTLAPGTIIRGSNRNIYLAGEAVFTVKRHSGNPFVVTTAHTATRVLGTTFGVRAYDDNVKVAVRDGKISINNSQILSAGDIANVTNNNVEVEHNANVNSVLAWTSGRLEYHSALLTEVVPDIERWYGVRLHLADPSLETQRFTGTLKPGSVAELANILELTYKAKVTRVGNVLTLETSSGR